MHLAICFMTGREDPRLDWVLDALQMQAHADDEIELIVIDALGDQRGAHAIGFYPHRMITNLIESPPKPTVWQGKHRVTSCDWWATANARNTALVLCPEDVDFIAFLDDRARPGPHWLDEVRKSYERRDSVIAGSYEKIEGADRHTTRDHRTGIHPGGKINCGGGWLYGCTFALPLAWALDVNGFEEGCDGLTGEDYIFGMMLQNAGHRIDFVPRLFVSQDREPGNESCKGSYACRDKGISPNDKSHAALKRFGVRKRTEFTPDLRALRARWHAGEGWPLPDPNAVDWYDKQPIRDMTRDG